MIPYKSTSGKPSGVKSYKIEDDAILVQFGKLIYKYSHSSCGELAVNQMKKHALTSEGLSTFISQEKPSYESKSLV